MTMGWTCLYYCSQALDCVGNLGSRHSPRQTVAIVRADRPRKANRDTFRDKVSRYEAEGGNVF